MFNCFSAISLAERRRWYFVMATIFVRLDTLMLWSHEEEKPRLSGFNRAVNLLKEVAKSELLHHQVLACAYLGKFCVKRFLVSFQCYNFFLREHNATKARIIYLLI